MGEQVARDGGLDVGTGDIFDGGCETSGVIKFIAIGEDVKTDGPTFEVTAFGVSVGSGFGVETNVIKG